MGGKVSRSKLINDQGKPSTFWKIPISESQYLYGSCLPVTNAQMKFFQDECYIGMIVTLTLEPLKAGRNINHSTESSTNPEYHDCDVDLLDNISMKLLHIPVQDGYPPTTENMKFPFRVEKVNEVVLSGKNVLVHCWGGKGRTSTMISGYLIYYLKTSPAEAINKFYDIFGGIRMSKYQQAYLLNSAFPENTLEKEQPSLAINTEKTAPCYTE